MTGEGQRAKRYRVHGLSVVYDTTEEFWTGPVVDVSESGLFVETTHELPIGTKVTVMPHGTEDERFPFDMVCTVSRVNELDWDSHRNRTPGIALRFDNLSAEQRESLDEFLSEYGIDPR